MVHRQVRWFTHLLSLPVQMVWMLRIIFSGCWPPMDRLCLGMNNWADLSPSLILFGGGLGFYLGGRFDGYGYTACSFNIMLSRACWHYLSHVTIQAIWMNERKIKSSLSYLVHTRRNAFSHRTSLSMIFLCLYRSWSYSQGSKRFFFGGTTGSCPNDWQSSLVLFPS